MKKLIVILILCLFYSSCLFSQTNPRMLNPDYMWTSFYDSFNTLDRNEWEVQQNGAAKGNSYLGYLYCWKDSSATVHVSKGDLLLSGIKYDNYKTTFDWYGTDTTVTTNL